VTAALDDYRVAVARQALAEMPPTEDIDRPYFWIGRLKAAVEALVTGWPSGVPGGLSHEARGVLAAALGDAADYREARAGDQHCADCEAHPAGFCDDHAADLDLHDAYVALAAELGLELDR
jgi:hypothetical protein